MGVFSSRLEQGPVGTLLAADPAEGDAAWCGVSYTSSAPEGCEVRCGGRAECLTHWGTPFSPGQAAILRRCQEEVPFPIRVVDRIHTPMLFSSADHCGDG